MQTEFIRIEEDLVQKVVRSTRIHVKSKAVRKAIEEYLAFQKRQSLKEMAGTLKFYTQKELERSRKDE